MSHRSTTNSQFQVHRLPPELWLRILRFATSSDGSFVLSDTPFEAGDGFVHGGSNCGNGNVKEQEVDRLARSTQLSIIRVCVQWYNLGIEFVYENIRLCHAMGGLLAALRRSQEEWDACQFQDEPQQDKVKGRILHQRGCGRPIGHWVKRIELSVRRSPSSLFTAGGRSRGGGSTPSDGSESDHSDSSSISDVSSFSTRSTGTSKSPMLDISHVLQQVLAYTPNLLVLAKSDTDLISHRLDPPFLTCAALGSLRRFDWQHTRMMRGYIPGGDDPSWGYDILERILRAAPRLECLCLGRRFKGEPLIENQHNVNDEEEGRKKPIVLAHLKTLRVSNASQATRAFIETWSMPNLQRLVMDDSLLGRVENMGHPMKVRFTPRFVEVPDPELRPFQLGVKRVLRAFGQVEQLGYAVAYLHQTKEEDEEKEEISVSGDGVRAGDSLRYEKLHTVRLHAPAGLVPGDRVGAFKRAFEMLGGGPIHPAATTARKYPSFPSLRKIVLYGPWDPLRRHGAWDAVVHDRRLREYLDRLVNEKGVQLLWSDGSEVRLRVWTDAIPRSGSDGEATP